MRARDVMTKTVVFVEPDTELRKVADLMIAHRVTGLPVIAPSGELAGMVTDGDLLRRAELSTGKPRVSWLEHLWSGTSDAQDFLASHGRTARDVMTHDVFAVTPETPLRQVADILERKRIRRVPVVAGGRLVGIVSRANLVQAFASLPETDGPHGLSDRRIRDLVLAEYGRHPWGQTEGNIIVKDGVVHLWGFVPSEIELAALRVSAQAVPGVQGFEDHSIRFFGDVGARPREQSKLTIIGPDQAA